MCVNDVLQWSAEVLLACVPAGEVPEDGAMGHRLTCTPGLAMVRVVVDAWLCDSRGQTTEAGSAPVQTSRQVSSHGPSLTPPTHRGD